MQRPAVFYVEQPVQNKKRKVDGDGNDKQPDRRKKTNTAKKSDTTGSTGQDSRDTNNPPQKRKPTSEAEEDSSAKSSKGGKKAAKTVDVPKGETQPEADKPTHEVLAPENIPQGEAKDQAVQGPSQNETRSGEGEGPKGGEVQRAPISEQKKAQLEAARKRANEVRKEKMEERQKQKAMKDELYRKHMEEERIQREQREMAIKFPSKEKIPDVLPQKPPPKYVSDPENAPPIDKYTSPGDLDDVIKELPRIKMTAPKQDKPVPPPPVALRDDMEEGEPKPIKKKRVKLPTYISDSSDEDDEDDYLDTIMKNRRVAKLLRKDKRMRRPSMPKRDGIDTDMLQDAAYLQNLSKARRDMLMQAVFGSN